MRSLRSVATLFSVLLAISLLRAEEPTYVQFSTGKIVAAVPADRQSEFGQITNSKDSAGELEPMAIGNFWVYESRWRSQGREYTDRYVVRIRERVKDGPIAWFEYAVESEFADDDENEPYYLRRDENSIYYKSAGRPPVQWIARKPVKGSIHKNERGTFEVSDVEKEVSLPWGKAKCVELVHTHDGDVVSDEGAGGPRGPTKDVYLYQPGVGVVAIISGDSRDQLIGFNVDN